MRPRLRRPTIRGLGASDAGSPPLALEIPDGRTIPLASPDFANALRGLHVVAVEYALGSFLVIAERRKRGDRYWVARAYHRGRRSSFYLGREFTEADVRTAAAELESRLAATVPDEPGLDESAVDAVIRDLVARERDPSRRAAAEAIAALVRRDHVAHRA